MLDQVINLLSLNLEQGFAPTQNLTDFNSTRQNYFNTFFSGAQYNKARQNQRRKVTVIDRAEKAAENFTVPMLQILEVFTFFSLGEQSVGY